MTSVTLRHTVGEFIKQQFNLHAILTTKPPHLDSSRALDWPFTFVYSNNACVLCNTKQIMYNMDTLMKLTKFSDGAKWQNKKN